jgi:hypothetical protein
MDSLSEIVEVVIGVDTHVATHSAAALDARTGSVLAELTVEATPDGYAALVKFADNQSRLRAWAIEGTGGHGAGLARHLAKANELVVELDRPERAKRRNGAKSDPLDAIRAAREALSRTKLGTPRTTGDRQALSVLWLPDVRRSTGQGSPSSNSFRSSSPPPSCFARSCAARSSRQWHAQQPGSESGLTSISKPRPQRACCATSPGVQSLSLRRPIVMRRRSSPSSASGDRTYSHAAALVRSSPRL